MQRYWMFSEVVGTDVPSALSIWLCVRDGRQASVSPQVNSTVTLPLYQPNPLGEVVTAAASVKDVQKMKMAVGGMGRFCTSCHDSHREQRPDKSDSIRP